MTTDFQKGLVAGLSIGGLSVSSESSEEGTSNYNDLENKPISLNENGEVVISEDYQEYFSSLEKDNDTIDYDEFINTLLSLSENGSVIINEKYQSFFDNFEKKNNTENEENTVDPLTPMVQYRYNLTSYELSNEAINLLNQANGETIPLIFIGATLNPDNVYIAGHSTSNGSMKYTAPKGDLSEGTFYMVAYGKTASALRFFAAASTFNNFGVGEGFSSQNGVWAAGAQANTSLLLSQISSLTLSVLALRHYNNTLYFYINGTYIGACPTAAIPITAGTFWFGITAGNWFDSGGYYYYDFAFSESAHSEEDIISNSVYLMKKYGLIEENPPEENSMSYNDLIDKPLSLDENNSITINEAYKEFFKNLIKEAVTELPIASNTALGGIKIGEGLTISEEGVLSVTANPIIPSNNGVLIASMAEVLEDKNLLINDTILSSNSYMMIEGQIINNTIIGGVYSNV